MTRYQSGLGLKFMAVCIELGIAIGIRGMVWLNLEGKALDYKGEISDFIKGILG